GSTTVRGNTLDLRRQAGDPPPVRGGSAPDPSGLEVLGSAGVVLDANVFTDIDGRTSQMDAIRLADVRIGTTGAAYGAVLSANRFGGGRTAVRSERASWEMTGSRTDSAGVAVLLVERDTVAIETDTIVNARTAAVQSTATAANVEVTGSLITGI